MDISQRLKAVPASPIRKLVPLAVEAERRGITVYHLNIGDPDIKTPDVMMNVLRNWKQNPIGYDQSQGNPHFLEALKTYYHRLGFSFIDIPHIQATVGGSEAIAMAMFAVTEPGEEILVFDPFYTNYSTYAAYSEIYPLRPIPTSIRDGFHLPNQEVIEKKITKKTRAILVCNPNNPTGTVYTKNEIEMLVNIVKKYHLFLLSDEVYREYAYDGRKQVSLLSYMQEIPKQAIVLESMSKRYSVCGIRVGALVSLNPDIMAGVLRIGQGRLSAGFIDQMIAAKLTQVPESYYKTVYDEYRKRRDVLYEALRKIPGIVIPKPEGAFYTIVKLPIKDTEHFCRWLLTDFHENNETIMLAPASGFYATPGKGKDEVRIAYVINRKSLQRAVKLLYIAVNQYKR